MRAEPLVSGGGIHPMVRFDIARRDEEPGQQPDAVRGHQAYLELIGLDDARWPRATGQQIELNREDLGDK